MTSQDLTGLLISLAQIGAAFAGFAALVSVLRERGKQADALHDILRLRVVISTSILVVAASLFPMGFGLFDIGERWVWGVSALLLMSLNYAIFISFVRTYSPVKNEFAPDMLAVGVVGALELLDQLALLAIIFNMLPEKSFALYIAALIMNILQAAFVFMRYVGSEFRALKT